MFKTATLTVLLALAASAQTADIGSLPNLRWTWDGAAYVSSFTSGNWYDGLGLTEVWTLDQGSGTTVVGGVAGVQGSISGAEWQTIGGLTALRFDGTNDIVDCGDNLDIGTDDMFVAAWIYAQKASTYQGIISKYQSSTNRWLCGLNNKGGQYAALQIGAPVNGRTSGGAYFLGEWMHVAYHVNRASGFAASYTNGAVAVSGIAAVTTGNLQNASSLIIGNATGLGYFQGAIRDVTIKHGGTNGFQKIIYDASKSRYGK